MLFEPKVLVLLVRAVRVQACICCPFTFAAWRCEPLSTIAGSPHALLGSSVDVPLAQAVCKIASVSCMLTKWFFRDNVRTGGGEIGKRESWESAGGSETSGVARPPKEAMDDMESERCNEVPSGRNFADMLDDAGTGSAGPCANPIPIMMLGALGPSSTRWPLSSSWWC